METSQGVGMQLVDEAGVVQWARGESWSIPADVWSRLRRELDRKDACTLPLGKEHVVDAWLLSPPEGLPGHRTLLRLRTRPAWMETCDLTERQMEIAELVTGGATIREVAGHLGLSTHTVRTHVRNIYRVLGVGNRLELARSLSFLRA